jgi:hypothetical protein
MGAFLSELASLPNTIRTKLTNNHYVEVESFAHTLAVPLVGQIGETNVASQFAANDVLHVRGSLSHSFWILRANCLSVASTHGVATLNVRRSWAARCR